LNGPQVGSCFGTKKEVRQKSDYLKVDGENHQKMGGKSKAVSDSIAEKRVHEKHDRIKRDI